METSNCKDCNTTIRWNHSVESQDRSYELHPKISNISIPDKICYEYERMISSDGLSYGIFSILKGHAFTSVVIKTYSRKWGGQDEHFVMAGSASRILGKL